MTHTITIAYASFNKAEAHVTAASIQKVYTEVDVEYLEVVDERSPKPSGSVVALVFDTHFNDSSQRTEWLTRWAAAKASVPLLPIAIDVNHGRPPSPISGIKSRFLGIDQNAILTSIGSLLGLALRRGENKEMKVRRTTGIAGNLTRILRSFQRPALMKANATLAWRCLEREWQLSAMRLLQLVVCGGLVFLDVPAFRKSLSSPSRKECLASSLAASGGRRKHILRIIQIAYWI